MRNNIQDISAANRYTQAMNEQTLPAPTALASRNSFLQGWRDTIPILFGVVPFGLIYGVVVNNAGFSPFLGQAMSSLIFAGSAQLVAARLFGEDTLALVVIATAAILNLRHMLYSASVAPFLTQANRTWKSILAYLLTDEAYAVIITKYENEPQMTFQQRVWYFFGAGLALWITWHISTGIGVFLGAQIPASWGLDFSVALTFIALVVPALRDRATIVAALVGGLAAVLLAGLPLKLGLLSAMLAGIVAGYLVETNRGASQ